MKTKTLVLSTTILGLFAASAMAASISATGNFEINQFGVSGDRDRSLVGDVGGQAGFVIQKYVLPTLGVGESFDSVSMTVPVGAFFNGGGSNSGFDVDLFGLNQNSSPGGYNSIAPVASMSTDAAALIQSTFVDDTVVTGTSLFFVQTSVAANVALAAYLNTQYAGGTNAGQTVFFRFSPVGGSFGGFGGYDIYNTTGNSEGGFTEAQTGNAVITYTATPEPTSLALLALGTAGLGMVRRHRAA